MRASFHYKPASFIGYSLIHTGTLLGGQVISDHFVLVGQFGLQIGDLLFQVAAASVSKPVAALLESRGSLLEENLLPLVKLGWAGCHTGHRPQKWALFQSGASAKS